MAGQNDGDYDDLEFLKEIYEINNRLSNVENRSNEQDETIAMQEQRLIILEEKDKKLKNIQKKKSSWFSYFAEMPIIGNLIETVENIYENGINRNTKKPVQLKEMVINDKENLNPNKNNDLVKQLKIKKNFPSKNINGFNIKIFHEEKGEKLQNFREVNKLGEGTSKENKKILNSTTLPNNNIFNQNNRDIPSFPNNNGMPNNIGESSLSNNSGGDDPKNDEYKFQIKNLQETVKCQHRQNFELSFLLKELKQRILLQEHKVMEKDEVIQQNQEKIEKRQEEINKLEKDKIKLEEVNNKLEEDSKKSDIIIGVVAGATTGAAIGTFVAGPVGAVVGGAVGAVIGGVVGVVTGAWKAVKRFFGWF
ncbi:hypothetical protein ACQ4LE_000833 [Meloidogyne hapla]